MIPMKSRLIALDIDGTILDRPSDLEVPDAVCEAVSSARLAGARMCLCSSRPCYMMDDVRGGALETDALVGCGGAMIEQGGEIIYADSLTFPVMLACIEVAKKWDIHMSFAGMEKLYIGKKGPIDSAAASNPLFAIMEDEELLSTLRVTQVMCAFLFTDPGMPDSVVLAEPALSVATVCRSSKDCFVITNKGTDKGSAALYLANLWGIEQGEILAVGNDGNDIPMIKAAGVGVAVANAAPEVLEAADWIAPDVWNAGAAEAIRRFAVSE